MHDANGNKVYSQNAAYLEEQSPKYYIKFGSQNYVLLDKHVQMSSFFRKRLKDMSAPNQPFQMVLPAVNSEEAISVAMKLICGLHVATNIISKKVISQIFMVFSRLELDDNEEILLFKEQLNQLLWSCIEEMESLKLAELAHFVKNEKINQFYQQKLRNMKFKEVLKIEHMKDLDKSVFLQLLKTHSLAKKYSLENNQAMDAFMNVAETKQLVDNYKKFEEISDEDIRDILVYGPEEFNSPTQIALHFNILNSKFLMLEDQNAKILASLVNLNERIEQCTVNLTSLGGIINKKKMTSTDHITLKTVHESTREQSDKTILETKNNVLDIQICTKTESQEQTEAIPWIIIPKHISKVEVKKAITEKPSGDIFRMILDNNNKRFFTSGRSSKIDVWDLEEWKIIRSLEGHTQSVSGMTLTNNDDILISASDDKTLKIWDLKSYSCLQTLSAHSDNVNCICDLSTNRLVSGDKEGLLILWEGTTNLNPKFTLTKLGSHKQDSRCWIIEKISTSTFIANSGNDIIQYKLEGGSQFHSVAILQGHSDTIRDIKYLQDTEQLLTASSDKTCKLWCLKTNVCLNTFVGHKNIVWSVLIVSLNCFISGDKEELNLWELKSGKCIKTIAEGCASLLQVDSFKFLGAYHTMQIWDYSS
jgi:WD40 repeat protein